MPYPAGVPDAGLKRAIETEFRKLNYFKVVASVEEADLVFLIEASWVYRILADTPGPPFSMGGSGDEIANFLQGATAIAVPSSSYARFLASDASLVGSAVWSGETLRQSDMPARPEDLVKLFHDPSKLPGHSPLCLGPLRPRVQAQRDVSEPPVVSSQTGAANSPASSATQNPSCGATIKIDVNLVSVPVVVTDSEGRRVAGLREPDFRLYEDGVEQKIARILPESEPFSIALVMDCSGSMYADMGQLRKTAGIFLESLRPEDRVMAISFGGTILLESELTTDRHKLRRLILGMINSGWTRLYDALQLTMTERLSRVAGRKAIVLLTDGVDIGSGLAGAEDTLALFAGSDVPVYVIQYDTKEANTNKLPASWKVRAMPDGYTNKDTMYARASRFLQGLTDVSGGRLEPEGNSGSFENAVARIAEDLGQQYTLCYYPLNLVRDGALRRLRVEVNRQDVKIRARASYRANPLIGK